MTTLMITFFVLLGIVVFAMPVARLRSERRLRTLRANGTYPKEGGESEADIDRLKGAGETVLAVRCYRAVHHVSLADAHAAILGRPKKRGVPAIFFLAVLLTIIAYAASRR
jgi:hypothetical protein